MQPERALLFRTDIPLPPRIGCLTYQLLLRCHRSNREIFARQPRLHSRTHADLRALQRLLAVESPLDLPLKVRDGLAKGEQEMNWITISEHHAAGNVERYIPGGQGLEYTVNRRKIH